MLASMAIHPGIGLPLKPTNLPSQSLLLKPLKNPIFSIKPKTSNLHLHSLSALKENQNTAKFELYASTTEPVLSEQEQEIDRPRSKERLRVVVKPMEKPRIVLKFIWMKKVIGIGLNQVIPGHGTIPLSPYYFWPKDDAWEQLRLLLESKSWISQNQMHILLSQATDMILLWQEKSANL